MEAIAELISSHVIIRKKSRSLNQELEDQAISNAGSKGQNKSFVFSPYKKKTDS